MDILRSLKINSMALKPTTLSRAVELTIINMFGWIPRPFGVLLRRLVYPLIFARVGRGAYIQMGVEFLGSNLVELGDDVKIMRNSRFDMRAPNSLLRLGNKVCIDQGVDIRATVSDCLIEIGDNSYLEPYVCMAGLGRIKIGKECLIASHTSIYANNHRKNGLSYEGIEIQDNVWIGSGVRILDGVTIGKGSIIGAGAVVNKNIPAFSTAVGYKQSIILCSSIVPTIICKINLDMSNLTKLA